MGDQLENFVQRNRDSFDDQSPNGELWNKIDQDLDRPKQNFSVFWKVAAVLFLASTIYLIQDRVIEVDQPTFSQEFKDAESYYANLISSKKEAIKKELTEEQVEEFLKELNGLDSLYDDLRNSYATNTTNERILDGMIYNLQLQLEILNKQLEILEQVKSQKIINDEIEI